MLKREEYLTIIEEIRNTEKRAIDELINKKLMPLSKENSSFTETLYKDIHYLLDDIDKQGENDLKIEDGDIIIEDGDIALTGYQSRLHRISNWLHCEITTKEIEKNPIAFVEKINKSTPEYGCIPKYDYTPEYKSKLDLIKLSLKKEREQNLSEVPYIMELMNNFNIDECILDAYYSITTQPTSKEEVGDTYVGRLHWYNNPFPYNIHGAYPIKHDYDLLVAKIGHGVYENMGISEDEINYYLSEYSKGFCLGFYHFEDDKVKSKSSLFNELDDYLQTIFDFATNTFMRKTGYPTTYKNGNHLLSGWFNAGKEEGYFYKAWYIILNNSTRFKPLFNKNTQDIMTKNQMINNSGNLILNENSTIKSQSINSEKKGKESGWTKIGVIITLITGAATIFSIIWTIFN